MRISLVKLEDEGYTVSVNEGHLCIERLHNISPENGKIEDTIWMSLAQLYSDIPEGIRDEELGKMYGRLNMVRIGEVFLDCID